MDAGWIDLAPGQAGAKIAPLIGASPHNVVMADSTSVNLFKVLSAACALKQGRTKIVTERQNFPTDNYIAEGVIAQLNQGHSLHYTDTPENLFDALDDDVAVVYLTHINYRNGRMLDMAALTRAAHAHGALMIWDLAHSTGAVPLSLAGTDVDFAVGCTYKYPWHWRAGCVMLSMLRTSILAGLSNPFQAGLHTSPLLILIRPLCRQRPLTSSFAGHRPSSLLLRWMLHWISGKTSTFSMLREKSLALTDYFIDLVEARCAGKALTLITPREHSPGGVHMYPLPIPMAAMPSCLPLLQTASSATSAPSMSCVLASPPSTPRSVMSGWQWTNSRLSLRITHGINLNSIHVRLSPDRLQKRSSLEQQQPEARDCNWRGQCRYCCPLHIRAGCVR